MIFLICSQGAVDFYQDWNNYSTGFGNLSGEFWLGLEKINRLTNSENVTLRIDLKDFSGVSIYAKYDLFMIEDISQNFKLTVGYFEGTHWKSGGMDITCMHRVTSHIFYRIIWGQPNISNRYLYETFFPARFDA